MLTFIQFLRETVEWTPIHSSSSLLSGAKVEQGYQFNRYDDFLTKNNIAAGVDRPIGNVPWGGGSHRPFSPTEYLKSYIQRAPETDVVEKAWNAAGQRGTHTGTLKLPTGTLEFRAGSDSTGRFATHDLRWNPNEQPAPTPSPTTTSATTTKPTAAPQTQVAKPAAASPTTTPTTTSKPTATPQAQVAKPVTPPTSPVGNASTVNTQPVSRQQVNIPKPEYNSSYRPLELEPVQSATPTTPVAKPAVSTPTGVSTPAAAPATTPTASPAPATPTASTTAVADKQALDTFKRVQSGNTPSTGPKPTIAEPTTPTGTSTPSSFNWGNVVKGGIGGILGGAVASYGAEKALDAFGVQNQTVRDATTELAAGAGGGAGAALLTGAGLAGAGVAAASGAAVAGSMYGGWKAGRAIGNWLEGEPTTKEDQAARAETEGKGFMDLAKGAVGLDQAASVERAKQEAEKNYQKLGGGADQAAAAAAEQKLRANNLAREKAGQLSNDSLERLKSDYRTMGAEKFKANYGNDQQVMAAANKWTSDLQNSAPKQAAPAPVASTQSSANLQDITNLANKSKEQAKQGLAQVKAGAQLQSNNFNTMMSQTSSVLDNANKTIANMKSKPASATGATTAKAPGTITETILNILKNN